MDKSRKRSSQEPDTSYTKLTSHKTIKHQSNNKGPGQPHKDHTNDKIHTNKVQNIIKELIKENVFLKNECKELKRANQILQKAKTNVKANDENNHFKNVEPSSEAIENIRINLSSLEYANLWKEVAAVGMFQCSCLNPSRSSMRSNSEATIKKFKAHKM